MDNTILPNKPASRRSTQQYYKDLDEYFCNEIYKIKRNKKKNNVLHNNNNNKEIEYELRTNN